MSKWKEYIASKRRYVLRIKLNTGEYVTFDFLLLTDASICADKLFLAGGVSSVDLLDLLGTVICSYRADD